MQDSTKNIPTAQDKIEDISQKYQAQLHDIYQANYDEVQFLQQEIEHRNRAANRRMCELQEEWTAEIDALQTSNPDEGE